MVSHSIRTHPRLLHRGPGARAAAGATFYSDVAEAVDLHERNMAAEITAG